MNITDAEKSLDIIYSQLSKSEIFKGYRPVDIIIIGLIGACFSLIQPFLKLPGTFIDQWMILAITIGLIVLYKILRVYFSLKTVYEKKQITTVLSQLFPTLLAGFFLFVAFRDKPSVSIYLPGLLSIIFGLGLTSMIPYLSKMLFVVVFLYILGGFFLFYLVIAKPFIVYKAFGLIFAVGHITAAYFIRRTLNGEK